MISQHSFQTHSSSTASSTPSVMINKRPRAGAICFNRHRCALLEEQVRLLHLLGSTVDVSNKAPEDLLLECWKQGLGVGCCCYNPFPGGESNESIFLRSQRQTKVQLHQQSPGNQ